MPAGPTCPALWPPTEGQACRRSSTDICPKTAEEVKRRGFCERHWGQRASAKPLRGAANYMTRFTEPGRYSEAARAVALHPCPPAVSLRSSVRVASARILPPGWSGRLRPPQVSFGSKHGCGQPMAAVAAGTASTPSAGSCPGTCPGCPRAPHTSPLGCTLSPPVYRGETEAQRAQPSLHRGGKEAQRSEVTCSRLQSC